MSGFRGRVALGTLGWTVFAVAAVLCRGVRWDETFEHAQVLAGTVAYPAWHPLPRYVAGVLSLQTRLSAWVLAAGGGAALLCGLRNVLFLLATVLPVYLWTASLTRRARWGHLAALLLLQGVLLSFDGSYPTFVWPELYSNGHVGIGVALLTAWALAFRRWPLAGLLLGLLPAVHLGQLPPVLVLAAWGSAMAWRRGDRAWLGALPWLAAGLAVSVATWLLTRGAAPPAAADPEAVWAVWRGYTFHHDPHRAFPPANGHVLLAGTLLLAWVRGMRGRDGGALLVYTAAVAGLTWGTMLLHALLGERLPYVCIVWMPYRLINHLPPLCLALVVAALARDRRGAWLVPAGLAGCLLAGYLPGGGEFRARYLADGAWVAFGLYGAALACAGKGRTGRWTWLAAALALAPFHQFGAACVAAGVLARRAVPRVCCDGLHRLARPAAVGALATVGLVLPLAHQARQHAWLPVSGFERAVAAAAAPGDVLVGPPETCLLQAKTVRAVLAETATPSLISYVPALGPDIERLYLDLYGLSFATAREGADWRALWGDRSAADWEALAERYGFTHVLGPEGVRLVLPVLVDGGASGTLYAVRGRGPAGARQP